MASETVDGIDEARQYRVCEINHIVEIVPECAASEIGEIEERNSHRDRDAATHLEVRGLWMLQGSILQKTGRAITMTESGILTVVLPADVVVRDHLCEPISTRIDHQQRSLPTQPAVTQKSQSSSSVASALPMTYDEPEPLKKSWFSSAFGDRAERIAGFTFVTDAGNIAS